jgi:2-polyprenyl-3-methyl-5-hydroxy-6-metoxy-1,4-benzoquinol methylase
MTTNEFNERLAVNDGLQDVQCPLCGGAEHTDYVWAPSHYGPERFRVTRCKRCRMIFTNPQPVTYSTEVAQRGVLGRHFRPATLARRLRIARLMLSVIAPLVPGRRVLDFGCGEGAFVSQALAEGWDALGVDLNAGLVEEANRHWKFEALSACSLDDFVARHPRPFDAIVTSQVFEHLQDPVGMGVALKGLLKPGGVLYIDVPNANQLQEWLSPGRTLDPTAHWNHFTVATLSDLVRRIGCEVVSASGAPSLVNVYHRARLGELSYPLARATRRVFPNVGTGACVIGRRPLDTSDSGTSS